MIYINNKPFGDKSFPNGETIFDMAHCHGRNTVTMIGH